MVDRRRVLGGLGSVSAAGLLPGRARAALPMPKSPLALTVVDVAGNLALTQKAIDSHRRAKPGAVSRFVFIKAPAPELPAKIKAQQDVTLDMAPEDSREAIRCFGRPEYDALIADRPLEVPLDAKSMVSAFGLWDQRVGAGKG